jgi:hypothetical protein
MTPEFNSLRMELEQLRQTVRRLQRNWRTPSRFGLLAIGVVLGLIAARWPSNEAHAVAQDKQDNKELVCSSLKVVGPNGKEALTLGADADGGVLELLDVGGKTRMRLSVANKQGSGRIELFDNNKQRTVFLGTDEDGAILELSGVDGQIRTIVAVATKQGGGLINLFDAKKKLRLVMEATDQGAVIEKR